ncbi:MAG: sugar ABC transporter ATP-binding protein [Firmicutes bacterium]|nr:sugar ABC transporter ATP-binding protein [Bacillota bacterium]
MKPTIQAVNISKEFPGVKALTDVSIDFYPGEVHALLGENGAGKSTLIKILSGVYTPTSGKVLLDGEEIVFTSPYDAINRKIAVIHQELSIAPDLTVAENIFLGSEPKKKNGLLDRALMNRKSQEILDNMGIGNYIKATDVARNLTAAQQQMAEIAKVINREARVVILDEPTSSLSEYEIEALFNQIRKMRDAGVTLIYISHRMAEIFTMCDRATVLMDGTFVCTKMVQDTNEKELVASMVGREIGDYYNRQVHTRGREMLRVEGLCRDKEFENVSFTAYAGEILGVYGLIGAGRTETMETVFGAREAREGKVFVKGEEVHFSSPLDAIAKRIGMVTEDRRRTGLMLQKSVKDNAVLPSIPMHKRKFGFANPAWEKEATLDIKKKLMVKTPSIETTIGSLSGGNQQKVILGKWLLADSEILILDEPTRGIDVNAKSEFYALMNEFVANGGAIVMISSEMPEVIGISDRIIVMHEGKVTGELTGDAINEHNIIMLANT